MVGAGGVGLDVERIENPCPTEPANDLGEREKAEAAVEAAGVIEQGAPPPDSLNQTMTSLELGASGQVFFTLNLMTMFTTHVGVAPTARFLRGLEGV